MSWYEILIIIAACAFVVGVIVWRIVRKMQGKSGCDECGGCSNCSACSYCRTKKTDKK